MLGIRLRLEDTTELVRIPALAKLIHELAASPRMKIQEVADLAGVKRSQAFNLIRLAKLLLPNYVQGHIAFDPRKQSLQRVFRKGICEVLSCCLDFAPVHLRNIARLSRLPPSTVHMASKLLLRQGIIQDRGETERSRWPSRPLSVPSEHVTEVPAPEWATEIGNMVLSAGEWCHAVIAVPPAIILFIAKNASLQGDRLQKLVTIPTPSNAQRILTDRNSWLSIGLELVKTRLNPQVAEVVWRSIFGIPIVGDKPRPEDLFDAAMEVSQIDTDRMQRWLRMRYVQQYGDSKVFTQKGLLMVRHRYSRIGLMKVTRIETVHGLWKLVLV